MSTLRDGLIIESYEKLIKVQHRLYLYQSYASRLYSYGVEYGSPGLVNMETGERFFGSDIKKFITFPLHQIQLAPWTEEDERRLDV